MGKFLEANYVLILKLFDFIEFLHYLGVISDKVLYGGAHFFVHHPVILRFYDFYE